MIDEKEAIEPREPHDIFQMFDSLDDDAIVAELEGRFTEVAVYHFPGEGGKEVWGIGKVGIDICVSEMAKKGIAVRDDDITWAIDPTDPAYVIFKGKAHRHFIGKDGAEAEVDSAIGVKRQWTKLKRRDGSIMPDPFWAEKGAMKAIRNARMRLIPEDIKAQVIAFAKDRGRVKEIKQNEIQGQGARPRGASPVTVAGAAKQATGPSPTPPISAYDDKLEIFKAAKKCIGEEAYREILGAHGYEHANQIKGQGAIAKMDEILAEMRLRAK